MNQIKYKDLAKKHGTYASWAIWNPDKEIDRSIIDKNIHELHNDVIMLGLNISSVIHGKWRNFHGGPNLTKIVRAFNDSPYRGAYMSDLIKNAPVTKAADIEKMIKNGKINIIEQIDALKQELRDVGATRNTLFIIFGVEGSLPARLFREYLADDFPNICYIRHYSSYGPSTLKYVTTAWDQLEAHYNKTKIEYSTPLFERTPLMNECLKKLEQITNETSPNLTNIPKGINYKSRTTPATSNSSEEAVRYQLFFENLRTKILNIKPDFTNSKIMQRAYWPMKVFGTGKVLLLFSFVKREKSFRVVVYITTGSEEWNKQIFESLSENKEIIEENIGYKLTWDSMPNYKANRIYMAVDGSIDDSEQRLNEIMAWAVPMGIRFKEGFAPHVNNILF